jgi:hypothetical protein
VSVTADEEELARQAEELFDEIRRKERALVVAYLKSYFS